MLRGSPPREHHGHHGKRSLPHPTGKPRRQCRRDPGSLPQARPYLPSRRQPQPWCNGTNERYQLGVRSAQRSAEKARIRCFPRICASRIGQAGIQANLHGPSPRRAEPPDDQPRPRHWLLGYRAPLCGDQQYQYAISGRRTENADLLPGHSRAGDLRHVNSPGFSLHSLV